MSKSSTTSDTELDRSPAGTASKLKLLIALAVVVAVGAAAWFFLLAPTAEAEAPHEGAILALEPVAVNLADGGYLKVGIALQLVEGAGGEEAEVNGSKATDLLISTFSQAPPADVTAARDTFKASLQEKIVQAYDGEVMHIYFIEYVTQ